MLALLSAEHPEIPPGSRFRAAFCRRLCHLPEWSAAESPPGSPAAAPPDPDVPQLFPPGHFYSPVPSMADVRDREAEIFGAPPMVPGIDLREEAQLDLLATMAALYEEQPFHPAPSDGVRYHFENEMFSYGDGLALYAMLRHLRPSKYVEIGSGFSSALALDVNERFLGGSMACTFIEPHPERLHSLLRDGDVAEVIASSLQHTNLEIFRRLGRDDVLFIDSTHVAKVGSDVNLIVHELLPELAAGVVVHVHDIFYPFEYPRAWVYEGRGWNEAYLLRAFLAFNDRYRVLFFNSFLERFHRNRVAAAMPLWDRNPGGSLWLVRADEDRAR